MCSSNDFNDLFNLLFFVLKTKTYLAVVTIVSFFAFRTKDGTFLIVFFPNANKNSGCLTFSKIYIAYSSNITLYLTISYGIFGFYGYS